MLVFIDDSGDAGFKLDGGSSKFFIIALVIFTDELEAEKTAVAIKEFRRSLKFPDSAEFRFFKTSSDIRRRFLKTIDPFQFKIRSIVIDKSLIESEELRNNKSSFYSYAIKLVLQHSGGSISEARIKIDGSGDRIFRRNFLNYIKKGLNSKKSRIMKDCKFVDSKSNVLIQMADMVAGSIRRSYDKDKSDSTEFKRIIKKHIEDEWKFK